MKFDIPKKWLADRIEQFGEDKECTTGNPNFMDINEKNIMRKAIIMSGISGMGKSTYVAELMKDKSYYLICPDNLRERVTGDAGNISKDSYIWSQLVPLEIAKGLKTSDNICFDATQLNQAARKPIIDLIIKLDNINIECHYFEPSLDLAMRQNKMRTRQVPEFVIINQFNKWKTPKIEEGFSLVKQIN